MANLLYAGFQKGCYVGWDSSAGDYEPGSYCYGYGDNMASYYADLKPNTTYTIQRIDSTTRFRLGLSSDDLKVLEGEQHAVENAFSWGYRADSSDAITFTTGASDTHLVVYYTNNSEYSARVMLNEGSTIQPYEAPTVPLSGWVMQNSEPTNVFFVSTPDKPFHGDSPYTFWRIDPNANDGMPYVGLMIGVPALATEQIDYLPITYKKEKLKFFMMLIGGAPEPEDTNYVYIVDENDNAILVMYKGTNTVVTTPRKIDNHPVVGIMSTCYSYNTNITSITIRDGVEVID